MSLDPEGAFFLGAKVGRRSLDFVLVDFVGGIRHRAGPSYPFPTPRRDGAADPGRGRRCEALLGDAAARIAGLGLAMPFELWSWAEEIGAPGGRARGLAAAPTSAPSSPPRCPGRSTCRTTPPPPAAPSSPSAAIAGLLDFVYFYVGAFIGGGLVLNGGLFAGRTGNAAALGSMPVPDGAGGSAQLIDVASLVLLERRLRDAGPAARRALRPRRRLERLRRRARRLAGDARRAASPMRSPRPAAIIDFEAAVIDGAFPAGGPPPADRARSRPSSAGSTSPASTPPALRPGSIGPIARALGGASLPLFDRYLVDPRSVGLRSPGEAE